MKITLEPVNSSNAHPAWTDYEVAQLLDLASNGYTTDKIAEEVNRSPSAVYSRLCKAADLPDAWPPPVGFDLITFAQAIAARQAQDDHDRAQEARSGLNHIGVRKNVRARYHAAMLAGDLRLREQMLSNEPAPTERVRDAGIQLQLSHEP